MKTIVKLIALVALTLGIVLTYINRAEAGGPWIDQYCDVETTTIRIVDQSGNVVEEKTEEKVTCNDGAKIYYMEWVLLIVAKFTLGICH